jgi:DNA-3-methyladenine glycosylase
MRKTETRSNLNKKRLTETLENFVTKKQKVGEELNMENISPTHPLIRLPREFYMTDVVDLAKNLLGKIVVRIIDGVECRVRIVETEAYKAPEDKACHAYNNKKTDRTKYFWQVGGCLYVYMIHNSNCLNITAATAEEPEAVLIRAVEPLEGVDKIKELRKLKPEDKLTPSKMRDLTNGPGKVGAALNFNKSHNGLDLCKCDEAFLVDDPDYKFTLERSVRINIDYAGEWKFKPWRFYIKDNQFVSKVKITDKYIDE